MASFRKRGCKCPKGKGKKCTCGATWSFRIDVGYDAKGNRKQKEFTGYATKAAAEVACADMVTKYSKGDLSADAGSETVESFMKKFLDTVLKNDVEESTLDQKYGYMNNYIIPELGRIKLPKLSPIQVQAFINSLTDKELGPGSIRNILRLLNQTMNKAVEWGYTTRNVVTLTSKPVYKPAKPVTWDREQYHHFLTFTKNRRFYPMYLTGLTSGMRPGELCAFSRSQFDSKAGTIFIDRTVVYTKEKGLHIKMRPKNDSSRRLITIPQLTVKFLKKHLLAQMPNELDLVFPNTEGGIMYESVFAVELDKDAAEAGLPQLTPHGLRHTHATYLLSPKPFGLGQSVQAVAERLGHSKNTTTWNTYAHVMENMQTSLADVLDESLKSIGD